MQSRDDSPFHAGERAAQARAGVRVQAEAIGRRIIRSRLSAQHRAFFRQLSLLVIGALDGRGRAWASPITGAPGFIDSASDAALVIDARLDPGDPLARALNGDPQELGALGIELRARRRNRVNGRARIDERGALELRVTQAFGNCPQHIHPRTLAPAGPSAPAPGPVDDAPTLSRADRALIARADTFFIASVGPGAPDDPRAGVDASHRGGPAGFVSVLGPRGLSFPDYAGNNLFNTIGNLELDGRAGLLFLDLETGMILQLSGRARVRWLAAPAPSGGRRVVELEITDRRARPGALRLRAAPG